MSDTALRIAAVAVPMALLLTLGIDIGKRRARRRAADELRASLSASVSGVGGLVLPAPSNGEPKSFHPPHLATGSDGRLWEIKTDGNWHPADEDQP